MKKVYVTPPPEPEICPTNFFKPLEDGSVIVTTEFIMDSDFSSFEIDTLLANGINVTGSKVSFTQQADLDSISAIEDTLSKNVESFKTESK